MDHYVIGIDIGTQGTKCGIYDSGGKCYAQSYEQSVLIQPQPGIVTEDPDRIFGSVLHTIKEAMEKSGILPEKIDAVSIAGQMAGIMGVDKDWNAVTPYDSWLDTRCAEQIRIMKETAEEEVIKSTGGQITYAHGPKILWWKKENPQSYKQIDKFLTLSAYVSGRLCGLKGKEGYFDNTHLHFTGFSDASRGCWNKELLKEFDVDEGKMGRVISSCERIGGLLPQWAVACGLLPGTPVAAGCGDSAGSSLGSGITRKGILNDVAGTASIFSAATDVFAPDVKNKTILYAHSVLDDLWIPLAYISGGGLCLRWYRDMAGVGYDVLDPEAEKIAPGSEGLYFIPHFAGRTCPSDPGVKGSWLGLDWKHTRGHMFRSIMESIAYEYSYYCNIILENTGLVPSIIYGTGGGVASGVFNRVKCNVLGVSYVPVERSETGTWGSALVAGAAGGWFKDSEQLRIASENAISKKEILQPDEVICAEYKKHSARYIDLLNKMSNIY